MSQQIETFSAFRHSLSQLTLQYCTVTVSALAALTNCFPSLDRLDFRHMREEVDGKPAFPLCRPLTRKLYISAHNCGVSILGKLSELGLVPEELVLHGRALKLQYTPSAVLSTPWV